jgi:Gram-negative bacterial TonB protein C-terminal
MSVSGLCAQTAGTTPASMPKNPAQFLTLALSQNDIDVEGLQPWELKATFQLFDEKGNSTQKLKLDEIWAGPKQQKQTWTSLSFNQIVIVNKDGKFRSGSLDAIPVYVGLALRTIQHPVPESQDIPADNMTKEEREMGQRRFDCVVNTSPAPPAITQPTRLRLEFVADSSAYCFDSGTTNFRFTLVNGDLLLQSNATSMFLGKQVAMQEVVVDHKVVRVKGIVDELRIVPDLDAQVFVPAADAVELQSMKVASGIREGRLVHRVEPHVPAAFRGLRETVMVQAIIGKDGHLHSVKVLGTPNSDLAMAASNAVRQWIYEPYLMNGKPVEIKTTVTVNFGQ